MEKSKWHLRFVLLTISVVKIAGYASCHSNPSHGKVVSQEILTQDSVLYRIGKDSARMVFVEGGTFTMGSERFADALPLREVAVSSFWMDEHEVTHAQFARFVEETGYVTVAERPLDPADFPGVAPELLVPGAAVFSKPEAMPSLADHLQWWKYVPGAHWRNPEGLPAQPEDLGAYPVTQVAYADAVAYAEWVGKRLPTEAEWEYAARASRPTGETYYWGTTLTDGGRWMANIFQGSFPMDNTMEDGYRGTAPVRSFPPNALGLYDLVGNVWEWCSDYYLPGYPSEAGKNPQGPSVSFDPREPNVEKRVQRGGSFLCSDQYCVRYQAGARSMAEVNSPTNHAGFRCVQDVD